ncbi:MarR family transcriptional regulator [Alteromonadaceae bacterium M269]|nr:MarR family transcriptional regulator [Alteromonadaceae bacterium M269]
MQKDEELLIALRRVIRAIDIRSKQLSKEIGLTGPQLLVLREVGKIPGAMVRDIAHNINLSPATVTSILDRLEGKAFVKRVRSTEDKRRVSVYLTDSGLEAQEKAPMHLQEHFLERFFKLEEWEQSQMVATMQRLASMMGAEELDAAPVLEVGSITP